jgi:NAD(P)-dependent dehydrogenase (short-subunit alcohol dehydrogenase family)
VAPSGPPILVTGATGALGRAVVAELLATGRRVGGTWIVAAERDALRRELGEPEDLRLIEADLGSEQGARAAVAAAAGQGGLSGAALLVGGYAGGGSLTDAPAGEFERMIELNLLTAQRTARAVLPELGAGGSLVLVGARAAIEPFAGAAGYIAAKAGVIALTRSIAEEYRGRGIRANAILPSVIDTAANREAMPDADHESWVSPAAIAKVVRFLLSADSAPTSGAAVPVYGAA